MSPEQRRAIYRLAEKYHEAGEPCRNSALIAALWCLIAGGILLLAWAFATGHIVIRAGFTEGP